MTLAKRPPPDPALIRRAKAERARRNLEAAKEERARRRAARAEQHQDDLVKFAYEVLGLTPWPRGTEVLSAIQDHDRVAIRAGRKVMKSTAGIAAAIWWAYRGGKVMATSATYAQLEDPLWVELRKLIGQSGLQVHVPLEPDTPVRFDSGGTIVGRVAAQPENMQGPSGADSFYLIDEASGVRRAIFGAIEGNVAGGGKIIQMGNPTQLTGSFYDAFHRESAAWHGIRISSRESPNVLAGRMVVPGLALPEWISEMERKHGPDSQFVGIHVDGEFPTTGANSVIPLKLSQAAMDAWGTRATDPGRLHLGVDVGRSGDDPSVVYARRGKHAYPPLTEHGTDSYAVARMVLTALKLYGTEIEQDRHLIEQRPELQPVVNLDVIGIGAGAYDVLHTQHGHVLEVHGINVAENATDPEAYHRLRDQLTFALKDWLTEGGTYPPHQDTHEELIAFTYGFDTRGRYTVSSKDEMKETLGRSPDHADALALSVMQTEASSIWVRSLA